jgi:multidrug efflux pump subunit AcrA (membrane-fusion protein)
MPPVAPASRSGALITWLVVFVLLWVTGTICAVYYYVDGNKAREDLDNVTKQYSEILPKSEINSDDINTIKNKRNDPEYNGIMSVVDILKKERDDLAMKIDSSGSSDSAIKAATDTLATAAAQAKKADVASLPPYLTQAVQTLTQALVARKTEIDSLNAQLKRAQDAATQAAKQMQANQATLTKALADARTETQQASSTLESDRSAKDEQMKKMIADSETTQKQAQDQLSQAQSAMADLTSKNADLQRRLNQALEKLGAKRSNTADAVVRQADGSIVHAPGNGSVYINLGSGDQISPGLTFQVYDAAEGVPSIGDPSNDDNLPRGKGSIEVVRVGAGSSECRIIHQEPGVPMHEGDLIANLVYDKNTKYRFYVSGDFDTDQNGVATPQEGEVIKRLVTQWGGKVVDKIDANTDFVVLGQEPQLISLSKDDANDPIKQAEAQNAQVKYDTYEDLKRQAIEYHIPILNQNRFLYFVGYYDAAKR